MEPHIATAASDSKWSTTDYCYRSSAFGNHRSWSSSTSGVIWRNVMIMSGLHVIFAWVCFDAIRGAISLRTIAGFWLYAFFGAFGVLAGAHRLWSHRSYKARFPLRILLMCLQTSSLQNDLFDWCRNHRAHHRFAESDADPHNSRRGFFFAHIGWLLCRKHPEVKRRGATIDMSDVLNDPVVRFQMRHYRALVLLLWLVLPISVSVLHFGERLHIAFLVNCWRYVISLHNTWLVNSLAHLCGSRPYDQNIEPRENKIVIYFALGEGYHNYHHSFPWDYSASERGWRHNYNLATGFIDFFAWCGLAYDCKVTNRAILARRHFAKIGDKLSSSSTFRNDSKSSSSSPSTIIVPLCDTLLGVVTLTMPVWLLAIIRFLFRLPNIML